MDFLSQTAILLQRLFPSLLAGFVITLGVAALAIPLALLLGLPVAALRMAKTRLSCLPARGFIELMRNTPLLLQIYLIYFGLPLLGLYPSEFMCGSIGIAVQHSAFLAEIYRSGIEAVSRTQWEAAQAIGMSRFKAALHVILPQAVLKTLGPIGSQLIIIVKDTSLVSAIGVMELTMTGKLAIERMAVSIQIFVAIAAFYLVLTSVLGISLRVIEHRVAGKLS